MTIKDVFKSGPGPIVRDLEEKLTALQAQRAHLKRDFYEGEPSDSNRAAIVAHLNAGLPLLWREASEKTPELYRRAGIVKTQANILASRCPASQTNTIVDTCSKFVLAKMRPADARPQMTLPGGVPAQPPAAPTATGAAPRA